MESFLNADPFSSVLDTKTSISVHAENVKFHRLPTSSYIKNFQLISKPDFKDLKSDSKSFETSFSLFYKNQRISDYFDISDVKNLFILSTGIITPRDDCFYIVAPEPISFSYEYNELTLVPNGKYQLLQILGKNSYPKKENMFAIIQNVQVNYNIMYYYQGSLVLEY